MRERRGAYGRRLAEPVDRAAVVASPACDGAQQCPQPADTDEAAASEARARYREHGLEPLEPDQGIRRLLLTGEQVLAVRHSVALDRRLGSSHVSVIDSIRGNLYVTTDRLVHVGEPTVTIDLDEIEDSALVGEKVLLLLHDGLGVALDAERPRLLRVQIAAARASRAGQADRPS